MQLKRKYPDEDPFVPNEKFWGVWLERHWVKIHLYIGRLFYVPALLFAIASSAGVLWIAFHAEESIAARWQYPIPDGLCRLPDVVSEINLAYASFDITWSHPNHEILDMFFPCEGDDATDIGGGFGIYVALPDEESGEIEVGVDLRPLRQVKGEESLSTLQEALSRVATAGEAQVSTIWFAPRPLSENAFYKVGIGRKANRWGTAWTVVTMFAVVESEGRILNLIVIRPYEDASTVDDFIEAATRFAQNFPALEFLTAL